MLSVNLASLPYNNNNLQNVSFMGYRSPHIGQRMLTPKKKMPLASLPQLYLDSVKKFEQSCYVRGIAPADAFEELLGAKKYIPKVAPVPSVIKKIGNNRVISNMDGGQIFASYKKQIQSAQKSIQIKMFEFQNVTVDGEDWLTRGAEKVPGYEEQRDLLQTLITKKEKNPEMKIQMILDVHKWHINSTGKKKHYNNQKMIVFLKKHGIDVVPATRDSKLNHDKYMIVDGEKAIIGGMNLGTHSAANHDFCWALESLDKTKPSIVGDLANDFNSNWKLAWHRIGSKKLVPGPLNEAEQKLYGGIQKEIKPENVEYYEYVKEFYDNPEAKTRFIENRLDLIEPPPSGDSSFKLLTTRPKEFELIGEKASESIAETIMDELKTCKEVFGNLFFLSDKNASGILIKRVKAGELKATFVVHDMDFPYCKDAFYRLVENGVDVRRYKEDKSINQRMHGKWMVFDNSKILVGSANLSRQALRQNLGLGFRKDMALVNERIEEKIKPILNKVKAFEDSFELPHMEWDGDEDSFNYIKKVLAGLRKTDKELHENGHAEFEIQGKKYVLDHLNSTITIDGKTKPFDNDYCENVKDNLGQIRGLYGQIADKYHKKETFKRGNSESAVFVESKAFVRDVFKPQLTRDLANSEAPVTEARQFKQKLNVEG